MHRIMTKGYYPPEREAVLLGREVNRLLQWLYEPAPDGWKCSERADFLTADTINWGDLHAFVEPRGDTFEVTIEEASPDSTKLIRWVTDTLALWGWNNVEVRCEW